MCKCSTRVHLFTCTGQAAPSPRAQIVCPSICLLSSQIMSISAGRASPFTKRHIILFIQSTPAKTDKEKENIITFMSSKRQIYDVGRI